MDKVAPLLMSFLEQQARPQVQAKVTEQLNTAKGAGNAEGDTLEAGGINFDFLKAGKEGMVNTTMNASEPVIKQVSENMSAKISSAIPGAIGNALQSMMGQQAGGTGGALGMATGLMLTFMNHGNATAPAGTDVAPGVLAAAGSGPIQQLCQNMLGPKITMLLKPFLAKCKTQMAQTLERKLRNKIFSSDYIKSTVMGMLTGIGGAGGAGNAILGGVMNAMMGGNGNGAATGGQQSD
ncbi:hypothetical protein BGW39_006518 [Mortierella sp. 14UC]|nr:hypothetical protein BGW39_006518 [Mortierella sp. 14UC]